ncbi:MAG: amino acid transporter [Polyangia bacterium]
MCLTGVDYFSTLGYQPGIAFLAAGVLSPLATLILILVTLFGALPVYRRVAAASPHGEGSIAMLERLLPGWFAKLFVLLLLGFAATDFIITITLSAADATAHLLENPFTPALLRHRTGLTLVLIAILGGIFLKGFKEAVGIAVVLVGTYLALNVVVLGVSLYHIALQPQLLADWWTLLTHQHGSPLAVLGVSLVLFPKLALGLSGFETGVAVMPLVRGAAGDTEAQPVGRVRNTKRLLLCAALIMSGMLLFSSVATTVLIPPAEFRPALDGHPAGKANGRALAYLAHQYLGQGFGTAYDLSTICILWFAGASALAGLLNIVPRYLPRYGMAPEWARSTRPLVVVFIGIATVVTLLFRADVDAQGGAYATGVLFLMSSASIAVMLAAWRKTRWRWAFLLIALVFVYTTVANMVERRDGLKIAAFFIGSIMLASFLSRMLRTLELRVDGIVLDPQAAAFLDEAARGTVRLLANQRSTGDVVEYETEEPEKRRAHAIPDSEPVLHLEVQVADASEFSDALRVQGVQIGPYRVLRAAGIAVPNAIAALLLHIRNRTGKIPHVYFSWGEEHPLLGMARYVLLGSGDIAPLTREVLRQAEPEPDRRPRVHVG